MSLEQLSGQNIYNIIGVLVLCIIIYIVISIYLGNIQINIDNINNKFIKNKKLDSITFKNIKVEHNKIDISTKKIIDYMNKYLEKRYNQEYNLEKKSITDIKMKYNKDYNLYKISYILNLEQIILNVVLYLDEKNEVYISSITKKIDDKDLELDINIDNDLDLLDLYKNTNKLYDISNKIENMTKNGYNIIVANEDDDINTSKENINEENEEISGQKGGNLNNVWINDIKNNDTFLNGDISCEGCFVDEKIISCDIKKDMFSQYAAF